MKKALLLICICLLGCTSYGSTVPPELESKYHAWNKLCIEYRTGECKGIKAPGVRRVFLSKGTLGQYRGGEDVLVNRDIDPRDPLYRSVLLHEMSHYLDAQIGKVDIPGPVLGVCLSEKDAFEWGDEYDKELGIEPVGDKWILYYPHCWYYYDILFPEK